VHNGGTTLVILLLGDPHLLEGGERSKNRTTNPHGVFTLGRGDDLDLDGGGGKSSELLLHTVSDTGEHGCTTRENDVSV